MKRISMKTTACLTVSLLFMAACTNQLSEAPDTGQAIVFGPQVDSRAVVENTSYLGNFSVWGWYTKTASPVQIFGDETGGTTVMSPSWSYEGGTRFWVSDATYSFYGVHPNTVSAQVSSDGVISIADFDYSATGVEAIDLMTAVNTGLSGADAPMVNMSFSHELVRINFIARTEEGGMAYLTNAELKGVVCQGTLTRNFSNADTRTWQLSEQTKVFQKQHNPALEIDVKGKTLMDEMLLPPQTIDTETASISITYSYGYGEAQSQTVSIPAITWEAGKSYTYTLTIASDGRIHFASPVIDKWGEALGGIIIVE